MKVLIAKRNEIGLTVAVAVLVSVLAATTWFLIQGREESGPSLGATPDMPVYSSIAELSAAADSVILGTVKGIAGRETDYGTSNPDEQIDRLGIPTVFYQVGVTETIRGEASGTIIVGAPDMDKISIRESTALQSGEQVLMFLKRQTTEDAPGITAYSNFYVTVSLDNGVFNRLDADSVEPRMSQAFQKARFSLEEVRGNAAPRQNPGP